ncbi:MAG: hypothetical protein JWQ09_4134, partial [Segetibacter sp.]|nr:hypothetical protein [Segetibacter sp.]
IITCPADLVKTNEPGFCGAHAYFAATITDGRTYNLIYSKPSGALFPIGTTNVTVKAIDVNASAIATCSFNVTVMDVEAPKFASCPANIFVGNTIDMCGAVVNYATPTFLDICTSKIKTYNFSDTQQSFIVPAGVTSINVDITGASGGHIYSNGSTYGQPGLGGQVKATIQVEPGQILYINVGGAGKDGSATALGAGGFNGGADGGTITDNTVITYATGGGGGASDIRTSGTSLTDRIIVAGGGGATGIIEAGGNGGDLKGQDGAGGTSPANGGTSTQGGSAGNYANYYYGGNGNFGFGGAGAAEAAGGGGGGGFYGGGGGALGSGAGGSSYTYPGAKNVYHTQGSNEGNGTVTLSWSQPSSLVQTQGLPSGAVFPVGTTVNTFTATDAAGNSSQCSFSVTVNDNQKPVLEAPVSQTFNYKANVYAIPALIFNDNCGIATVTYTISGATIRSGIGPDATGGFNAGSSVITWSATDVHGNIETATTAVKVTVGSSINVSIPDVYAVSPGGQPNTIYHGYGLSNVSIKAIPAGGKAPYSYRWTTTGGRSLLSESEILLVFLPGEYTVTVTDATGATGTFKKIIQLVDVSCGNNNEKVLVCQANKGSTKSNTICVNEAAVSALLSKGSFLGECSSNVSAAKKAFQEKPEVVVEASYKLDVFPNPTSGQFSVRLNNFSGTKAEVILLSINGLLIERKTIELTGGKQKTTFNINNLNTGVYFVKVISDNGIQTEKVLLLP